MDPDKYNLEYKREDEGVEIDLVESDLDSVKEFLHDVKGDSKNIKNQGKLLAYYYAADIDLDFDEIGIEGVSIPDEGSDEFKQKIESGRETNIEYLENGVETERYFYLTYLMVIKYLFDLDISQPIFDIDESKEYNHDLSLEDEDLAKSSRENIDRLKDSVDNINMYFSVVEDL